MTSRKTDKPRKMDAASEANTLPQPRRLRVWPITLVVALQLVCVGAWVTPAVGAFPRFVLMMAGPLVCGSLFAVLLLATSRLAKRDAFAILASSVALGITSAVLAAPRSAMGAWLYGAPLALLLMWLGLVCSRTLPRRTQLALTMGVTIVGWTVLTMTRIDGTNGYFLPSLSWRWTSTQEELLLAKGSKDAPSFSLSAQEGWQVSETEWPNFRGPTHNAHVRQELPRLDWRTTPPQELWRRQVGLAWSSMCIVSGRLFTQEQRGNQEMVTCYDALTGQPIWESEEPCRFEEINSGAGPRATPSYADGKVFCYGAKGILLCLDASSGERLWRHDLVRETGAQQPIWGFTNSPLILGDIVVVYAGGSDDQGLLAFDTETGEGRWAIPMTGMNFSSAQPARFGGQEMLMFSSGAVVFGISPPDGNILWRYDTGAGTTPAIVQPQQCGTDTALIPFGDDRGVARIRIAGGEDGAWRVEELWRSRNLKPWYNDFLVQDDYVFGFDKQIFCCVALRDGSRQWKRGRFGFGQALLLEKPAQVIIANEQGEVILVDATAQALTELGRFTAFDSKSWNHPVVAAGRLYLRCDTQLACYQL